MTTASPQSIAEEIRSRREKLGWRQEALASRAGVAFKTIERIETGKTMPRNATLTVMRQALDAGEAAAA